MINIVDRYFGLNRTLLLTIGLWPYKKSKCAVIQVICVFFIMITGIIFQLTTFFTSKCTPDFIVKVLSLVFAYTGAMIKYNALYVNSRILKYFLRQFYHIYNDLRDKDEIAIVERYANYAKRSTAYFAIFVTIGASIFLGIESWACFRHTISSSNLSHSHQLMFDIEYFVDEEKYFYLIFLHLHLTMIISVTIMVVTGSILLSFIVHICGLFKIASYRIEKAIKSCNSISKNIRKQDEVLVHNVIVYAVDIHRKAMTFANSISSSFEKSFLLLILFGVLMLSFNMFRVVILNRNIEEGVINIGAAFCCLVYMFLANFFGQELINHNSYVYATAYKVQWYKTSLHIQRLILTLLQRGNKSFGLCIGGLFTASIECFATLVNASVSYFTLMYSMR